jgi:uncharacterized membrane protein YdjX (TVP38/TMEM64 family)
MLGRWAPLILVAGALIVGYAAGLDRDLSLNALRGYRADLSRLVAHNGAMAATLYVLAYVLAVALSFPGASVLTVAGGMMFGAVIGSVLAAFAATTGSVVIFLAARGSAGEVVAHRAGARIRALRAGFRANGFSYLLVLRLAPILPFWLVNLAAALFDLPLRTYVAATALGILPGTIAYSYFGEGLGTALDRGEPSLPWKLPFAAAVLGALMLLPAILRRRRRRARGEARSADPIR